jgi:DNA replication protein DnaC
MSSLHDVDLDAIFKRLNLANARRVWRELVQRAEKEDLGYEEFLRVLVAEEVAHRKGTTLRRKTRAASFPFLKTIDEFDFSLQGSLRVTTLGSYLTHDFVTEGRSLILHGKPGRGKTHLAVAIAYRAIQNGFDALFVNASTLIDDVSSTGPDRTRRDVIASYLRPHVLVVDEVGYLTTAADAANALFQVVHERHVRRRAMLFTTNKDPNDWGAVLHDDDLAAAIVDRILERGRLLRLDGPSGRTRHLPQDERPLDHPTTKGDRVSGKQGTEFSEPTSAIVTNGSGAFGIVGFARSRSTTTIPHDTI